MDRVTGPFDGHYVASSVTEIGGRYLGFAKVCCQRPSSFWLATLCEEPGCCAHLCGGGLFDTPEAALASAQSIAQLHLRTRSAERSEAAAAQAAVEADGATQRL
jgi:predicted RNase H-like HicB family nuclease